jgi:hypothetical protein
MSVPSRIRRAYRAARSVRRNAQTARRITREILTAGELDPKLVHQFLDYSPDSMLRSAATKLAAAASGAGSPMMPIAGLGHRGTRLQGGVIAFGLVSLALTMITTCAIVLWGLRGADNSAGTEPARRHD